MKLGTLKHQHKRDGELVVVSKDNKMAVKAIDIAPNLREAIENWRAVKPLLEERASALEKGKAADAFEVNERDFHSPLPRAFQWVDGSAFMQHVKLVRKARNAELPETLMHDPLMYQGCSDDFLAPYDPIPQVAFEHGTDFEGEIAVVTSDVPMGISPEDALKHIRLIMLCNDVSLRGLIPDELAKGFGFFQSKPASAFSPFAVTPDELGPAWQGGRLHLPLLVEYNGQFFGKANGKEMHFHFGHLIAHAARTRNLAAGSIVGSGTVSNEDETQGSSCLAEKRMLEKIKTGEFKTPFMKVGDTIKIEMRNSQGQSIFGSIYQEVVKADCGDNFPVAK